MPSPIRVFFVGNGRLLTDIVCSVLNREDRIQLVGSTNDPDAALEAMKSLTVNVVLIHASIEDQSILQLIQTIKARDSRQNIVVLGVHDSEEAILGLIEAGVGGFVVKAAGVAELVSVLESVQDGRTLCSPRITAAVFHRVCQLSQTTNERHNGHEQELSERQREVLQMIALGLLNKEIAQKLGITVLTVKNHVHNILDKLCVPHRRAAARYAWDAGMCKENNAVSRPRQ
jgi:DNA-binding NarL/FixJ family response regulator